MNILVTGGTGTVGSQVVRELLARGAQVQVLTRDPAKAAKLPAGVKAVTGDLSKVETVKRVFKGVDGVFLVNTVSPTEVHEGLFSVCALRDEQVKRLVYLSVQNADVRALASALRRKAWRRTGRPQVRRPRNRPSSEQLLSERLLVQGCDAAARHLSSADWRRRPQPRGRSRYRGSSGDRADDLLGTKGRPTIWWGRKRTRESRRRQPGPEHSVAR